MSQSDHGLRPNQLITDTDSNKQQIVSACKGSQSHAGAVTSNGDVHMAWAAKWYLPGVSRGSSPVKFAPELDSLEV